ncbi:PepSY domain-containing protein [Cellulophaga baltica]|uniref:PepSY domain-containing protein n=1 Tax=Cellulophaga TaxID=104264 RepID=UPI001C077E1B|nr:MULTISPECIES: PepSY domain-containing protein [Cellulophaga]MBU2995283.1 PepSY domain-containing protein [Cellulophaga baltica]MDO6766678.1 PepSY domain-containing protein [Cellulophaga sp. 1_MG-2023]
MTISIWRYSHLALAVSSFVFILLASLTGIILAFEPISEQIQPYKVSGFDELTASETISVFKDKYSEVLSLEIDANDFVTASVFTDEGGSLTGFFNPITADFIGEKPEVSKFFQFVTSLHRSLFLKSIGRFFVGLCSFLLFLITVSGTVLILKRQGGVRKFFTKVVNESFAQYWHVVLGRATLIPIIIITLTGVYLSLEKFNVFPADKKSHLIDFEQINATPQLNINDFPVLKDVQLSDVEHVEFPFSDDVEDYYTIKFQTKELVINQFTGEVLSVIEDPLINVLSKLSLKLHTGEGSIIWSFILLIATVNILFFIYSGFAMTLKRRAFRIKNKFTKNNSEYVILVGSENGGTLLFANALKKELIFNGKRVFVAELNKYTIYKNIKHLIVLTSTYGEGEAPANATNFLKLLEKIKQNQSFDYSVVGFGSLSYPDFCKFAFDVDKSLQDQNIKQLLPPFTINDKSFNSFEQWVALWSKAVGTQLSISSDAFHTIPKNTVPFKVVSKTNKEDNPDDTFRLVLKPKKKLRFTSGDLLAIYPKDDYNERLYSIAKVNGNMHLSVKCHLNGLGSNYLNDLVVNKQLKARVIQNKNFHFPKKTDRVIMIGNGTGIIPFIGMLAGNSKKIDTHLYCGVRTKRAFNLYQPEISTYLKDGNLTKLTIAYSKEEYKVYVQDLITGDSDFIMETLLSEGVLMVCGSLVMYKGVLDALEQICLANKLNINDFRHLIKSDCY